MPIARLRIEFLHEHATAPWQAMPFLVRTATTGEPGGGEIPLSFTLRARR